MARSVRTLLLLLLALAAALTPAPAAAGPDPGPVTIAVSYFDNSSGAADLAPLQKGFADMLITDLSVSDELALVERARLDQVLGEVALQKNPWFDQAAAVRLGKGLGAAYLLTGAYLIAKDTLRVDVRVIDVETGAIVFTASETAAVDDLLALERKLATGLLDGLGAKLTLLARKKVAAGGTRRLSAFRHYARSLDARDRGDEVAERAALREALAADPEFGRVVARVAALEKRVEALEHSGGRILKPTSAADHLHNARLQKTEGDYPGALASLRAAAGLDPTRVDLWLMVAELRAGDQVTPAQRKLDAPLRDLVAAYLRGDAEALYKALQAPAAARPLHAAAFLFDVVAPTLPARALRRFAMVHQADLALLAGERAGRLRDVFVDYLPLLERVRAAEAKYFTHDGVVQLEQRGTATVFNPDSWGVRYPWSELEIALVEEPSTPLTFRIERDRSHPSWAAKPAPAHPDPFNPDDYKDEAAPDRLAALRKAAADPDGFIYWITRDIHPNVPLEMEPAAPGRLGDPIALPTASLRCEPDGELLTGTVCLAVVRFHRATLPPGLYRVSLAYQDEGGHPVAVRLRAWAKEFKLSKSLGPRRTRDDFVNDRMVHFLTDDVRRKYPDLAADLAGRLGKKRFPVDAAVLVLSYFRSHLPESSKSKGKTPWPVFVEHISYDIDFSLRGGRAIEGDDPATWVKYRDDIIARGYQLRTDIAADQDYVPLPRLDPGRHQLCLSSIRVNGSRTPEAECFTVEIDRRETR